MKIFRVLVAALPMACLAVDVSDAKSKSGGGATKATPAKVAPTSRSSDTRDRVKKQQQLRKTQQKLEE